MIRRLYTLLFYILSPFLVLRLLWKSRHMPSYRQGIKERFALSLKPSPPIDIWIHAVSVGETIATAGLIEHLLPTHKLLLTNTTATGRAQSERLFGNKVMLQYLPYDLPMVLNRFLCHYQPQKIIIMETEIWPNLIDLAHQRNIPITIANARLSQRSFRHYCWISAFIKPILNKTTCIAAQTIEDANRFIKLGANPHHVHVMGNIKFDMKPPTPNDALSQALAPLNLQNRPVILLASTHATEERDIFDAWQKSTQRPANTLLMVAPRHPERFDEIYQMAVERGFRVAKRSELPNTDPHTDLLVIDSIGELMSFYQYCNMAFVGGSLVPVGGHNVLEPIACQKLVMVGPYTHNFKAICNTLKEEEAIIEVQNAAELVNAIVSYYPVRADDARVERATQIYQKNKGAISRLLRWVLQP